MFTLRCLIRLFRFCTRTETPWFVVLFRTAHVSFIHFVFVYAREKKKKNTDLDRRYADAGKKRFSIFTLSFDLVPY